MKKSASLNAFLFGLCLILFLFSGNTASAQSAFTASQNLSDSKIELQWQMDVQGAHRVDNPEIYFQIIDTLTGVELYSEIIDSINNFDSLKGYFVTHVKPNSTVDYQIRVLRYGPGTLLMNPKNARGTTLPFVAPTLVAQAINPWSIDLFLQTRSDYATRLELYRYEENTTDTLLVATLDTSTKSYSDAVDEDKLGSIVNGKSYLYFLKLVNGDDDSYVFSSMTIQSQTYDVSFTASVQSTTNAVELNWNSLKNYGDQINILRDGVLLVSLSEGLTSYSDIMAIPRFDHKYTIELLKDGNRLMVLSDTGSLAPNGAIFGYAFNKDAQSNFTIPHVHVTAEATVAGQKMEWHSITDVNGYYEFKDLPYYTNATFNLVAELQGGNIEMSVDLDLENPEAQVDFDMEIPSHELASLSFEIDSFKAKPNGNLGHVALKWFSTGDDTIHYLIYRGEDLIKVGYQLGLPNNEFIDLEGDALSTHTYKIKCYTRTYNESSKNYDYLFHEDLIASAKYPQPMRVKKSSFNVVGNSKAEVELNWSHPQGNIDGFKLFRDDVQIATVPKSSLTYTDLTGINGTSYTYAIQCFNFTDDGETYHSSKTFSDPVNYPNLSKPTLANVAALNGSAKLHWSYAVDANYNYDGFHVLRTYDGQTKKLASIRKELPNEFIDETGVPGRMYTYAVQAYKSHLGSVGIKSQPKNFSYPELPKVVVSYVYGNQGLIDINTESFPNQDYLDVAVANQDLSEELLRYRSNTNSSAIPWNDFNSNPATVVLRSVKHIDGVDYYSKDTTVAVINLLDNPPYELPAVSDFTASDNYFSHVKLSWDYPNYYVPSFNIYRNGYKIGSVEGVQKTFYDHDVRNNREHFLSSGSSLR